MGVRSWEEPLEKPPQVMGPPLLGAAGVALGTLLLLVCNGRPIGSGDTRPTERAAASLVQEADLDLDEYPEVEDPFARTVGEHRVSIYPVLSAVLAAPVFALARPFFALDETGTAVAGKLAAALFSALAAAVLFLAVGRRRPVEDAVLTAGLFALGTSVWSTSQALWQHPAAVLFLSMAVLCLVRSGEDPAWAGRAGLPLGLAAAARHADLVLVAVLAAGIALRRPRQVPWLVAWASPAFLFVLLYQWIYFDAPWRHGFADSLGRFAEPWGVGHAGLLVSPAKGLLVFTPVVIVAAAGMVRAFRRGERWLVATLAAAAVGHWLLMGRWSEWHGGESWGPRMMTDVLPLLFLFLPEGLDVLPGVAGPSLAALSVAAQALGAFAYDYRWERLYQRRAADARTALWDVARSPLVYYARRRVLVFALPAVREGRVSIREHPVVLFGPKGSRASFADGDDPVVAGSDPTFGAVHAQRGARAEGGRLRLRAHWDGLFLRVLDDAKPRRLQLRVAGRGHGTLYVGERTFWSEPRWTAYPMAGPFQIRHPYHFAESGGGDLTVTIGRAAGEADVASVALVPPTAPEKVIQAP
jgi:hypothetical protein